MYQYRNALPQLGSKFFITDGGLETTLVFHESLDLPEFAAFTLLSSDQGQKKLEDYFLGYIALAKAYGVGIILETPTWRASSDWGEKLGYSVERLTVANQKAVQQLQELRVTHSSEQTPIVVSGNIGPRGDGYVATKRMTVNQAKDYHRQQINTFVGSAADMLCAMTINYSEEATGIALAAQEAGMPVAIAFTVETDGKLPTGESLQSAIETVDHHTQSGPAYYMVNCAHPTHFSHQFKSYAPWMNRIHGIRANASKCSHEELDNAPELDIGNPEELARDYADLIAKLQNLRVLGGCCGTDQRHIARICDVCFELAKTPGKPG
jgi:S-methylmethionine-dependent homocysteine/selenocysteine methylase